MTNIIATLPDKAVEVLREWQEDGAQMACADLDEVIGLLLDSSTVIQCDDSKKLEVLRNLHVIRKEISSFIPEKGGEQ